MKMPRVKWIAFCGLMLVMLLLWSILVDVIRVRNRHHSRFETSYGGPTGVWTIQNPDQIEVYRLAPPKVENLAHWQELESYRVQSGPITLSDSEKQQVSLVFGTEANLLYDMLPGCRPSYEIRFHFVKDNQNLNLLVCLQCNMVLFFQDDRYLDTASLLTNSAKLLEICFNLWPDDPAIQDMKKHKNSH